MRAAPRFPALALLVLALSGCSEAAPTIPEGTPVACRLREARDFTEDCRMVSDGDQRIVYHPDGGFRRFTRDGSGWQASDGVDIATVKPLAGGVVQVDVAGDSYRLPAAP